MSTRGKVSDVAVIQCPAVAIIFKTGLRVHTGTLCTRRGDSYILVLVPVTFSLGDSVLIILPIIVTAHNCGNQNTSPPPAIYKNDMNSSIQSLRDD